MFKRYDPRVVRSYRSYKLSDLCRIYRDKKLHAQTIRGWINSGKLEAFNDGKNIMVYGAVLKQFLLDSNNRRKRSLDFSQFRCGKCKNIAVPLNNNLTKLTKGKNKCILAFGICSSCGHKIHRIYKPDSEQEILKTFSVQHNELQALYNHSCSTGNTHQQILPEIALSEPLEITQNQKGIKTPTSTNNTHLKSKKVKNTSNKAHIEPVQLTLF